MNIPPFVPARTVLEGLESEDLSDRRVKNEITDAKVKEPEETKNIFELSDP